MFIGNYIKLTSSLPLPPPLLYPLAFARGLSSNGKLNGALWFILVILPMIGIIFLLLYIVIREPTPAKTEKSRALEVLKERYAKGEITREEYL